ncbi:MAG: hypothetical protein HY910_13815 [Desulfarculus sp.]|nr:hypothetical protein [Desulfarculus sp.]
MGTIAIIALVGCGLLWVAAVVEFSRTLSELTRCRSQAGRLQSALAGDR